VVSGTFADITRKVLFRARVDLVGHARAEELSMSPQPTHVPAPSRAPMGPVARMLPPLRVVLRERLALRVVQRDRRRNDEHLVLVVGEHRRIRDLLERALVLLQVVAPRLHQRRPWFAETFAR
jgi:hypothetical protein